MSEFYRPIAKAKHEGEESLRFFHAKISGVLGLPSGVTKEQVGKK